MLFSETEKWQCGMFHWSNSVLRNYVAALLGGHRTLEFCFSSAELIGMARMHIKIIKVQEFVQ